VDSGGPAKTGELALFDAGNGHELEEISAPNVRDQYFLAISPNGRAIYHSGVDYSFVDLKRPFSDTPVVRVSDSNSAAVFFAK
jgi:hypothetical protein